MASTLFQTPTPKPNGNSIFNVINMVKNMGNPSALAQNLMQNNPDFNDFVNNNQGKTLEQIANENGIDYNLIKRFM
jgi:signal-transduction protein with cAMP-binding, CBS, and nucleotidyltransferase domain